MSTILGVAAGAHDASVTVLDTKGAIQFAGHAERYSRVKNDPWLNKELILDALNYAGSSITQIAWYEKPLQRKLRYLRAGQFNEFLHDPSPKRQLEEVGLGGLPVVYFNHHQSHAAAGFYTSPFYEATVVVADAIGEFDTFSVWHGVGKLLTKLYSVKYPHSIGLLYSAFTQRLGLKPNEDEYIVMGMAAYGQPKYADEIRRTFFKEANLEFKLCHNVHRGIDWWRPCLRRDQDLFDIAASIQLILEATIELLVKRAIERTQCRNLVFMGGVALNCVANTVLANSWAIDDMWIMPNPGDAGSSLGAAALANNGRIIWKDPYLGSAIFGQSFNYPLEAALAELQSEGIVAVAHGRAEFGPRALGNRSIFADPQTAHMKDKVNEIKRRQPFRPFAPVVLEEFAENFFDMHPIKRSPYMQFTARCVHPNRFPAIVHKDGTSRIQTVNRQQHEGLWSLLRIWWEKTKCPMLLNTSLNVKGQPLVNSKKDALEFSAKYGIKVLT